MGKVVSYKLNQNFLFPTEWILFYIYGTSVQYQGPFDTMGILYNVVFSTVTIFLVGKENSSLTEDECGCLHGGCYLNEKRIKKCECDFDFEGICSISISWVLLR